MKLPILRSDFITAQALTAGGSATRWNGDSYPSRVGGVLAGAKSSPGCAGIQVMDGARQVGLSHGALQRRFRALLKRSAYREILGAKIKRARQLRAKVARCPEAERNGV